MAGRPSALGSIKNGAKNPGQPPPLPGRIFRLRVPPKVKAKVKAGEIARGWHAEITVSRELRPSHPAIVERIEQGVPYMKRALKDVQLQASATELNERQARPRETQSLNLVHWRKML